MKSNNPKKVLLICEGTFPFNTGGVSTWANDLCSKISDTDFIVYSINANVEAIPKYAIGENIKSIIQVPMWSPEEPLDCVDYNIKYSDVLLRKEQTTTKIIKSLFLEHFIAFIKEIYAENTDILALDHCFYKMWSYFQVYDYKITMCSDSVWRAFHTTVKKLLPQDELVEVTLEEVTIGLRWIYRFLIPMAIDVPKVDISHVTISGVAVIPALALKYQNDTPILVTEHGVFIRERLISISSSDYSYFLKKMLIRFSESITKLVYHHATKITTVSKFNMSWETYYGAEIGKIEVIYNGVDHTKFRPVSKPKHLQNVPTVVAAARIFDLKDILTMIRTCNEVRKVIPEVQFLIYGNKDAVPEYTDSCEELIRELSLEENFHLKGFHDSPHQLYAEGDISILTSISEGFPYTVIESMSCGIPVVSTDVGGVSEALDDQCGVICKPKDYVEIGNSVIRLLSNEDLRKQMGLNARKKVIENFTLENFIRAFEDTYENLNCNRQVKLNYKRSVKKQILPQEYYAGE